MAYVQQIIRLVSLGLKTGGGSSSFGQGPFGQTPFGH